jgi:hypothetical protein
MTQVEINCIFIYFDFILVKWRHIYVKGMSRGVNGYGMDRVEIFLLSYPYKITLIYTLHLSIKIRFIHTLPLPVKIND